MQVQLLLFAIIMATGFSVVTAQNRTLQNATESEFPTHPGFEFADLRLSDVLKAKAMLRWLINNRTENGTKTFNAGFIRLIFHDCVGGCDGCVNLRDPSNSGLGFYKLPLDLMYRDFVFPMMSRADWYALAGLTAVEYAAELTPCKGRRCKQALPDLHFLFGRKDCVSESNLFRFIPGPTLDPRFTIRNTFRLNFVEITALMGAHCLGKNHQRDQRWVDDGTKFNNQYYKDMLDTGRKWKRGDGNATSASDWTSETTGNVMLSSDMFMAFDVFNAQRCKGNPVENCNRTNTFQLVQMFAQDNEFWMREFSVAFNVMLMNGRFGRLKIPVVDTLDTEWRGDAGDLFKEEFKNTETEYEFDREAFGLPPLPVANTTNNATDAPGDSASSTNATTTTMELTSLATELPTLATELPVLVAEQTTPETEVATTATQLTTPTTEAVTSATEVVVSAPVDFITATEFAGASSESDLVSTADSGTANEEIEATTVVATNSGTVEQKVESNIVDKVTSEELANSAEVKHEIVIKPSNKRRNNLSFRKRIMMLRRRVLKNDNSLN